NPRQVKVDTAAILDGTANTLLAGEKRLHMAYLDINDPSPNGSSDNESCFTSAFPDDVGGRVTMPPEPDMHFPYPVQDGGLIRQQFGSSHPGGANFVMADGSVRTIRFTISPAVFTSLGQRRDGKAISNF